ncbi:hypothetical protein C8R47DRAFT_1098127, partial [Mycena vitilis]
MLPSLTRLGAVASARFLARPRPLKCLPLRVGQWSRPLSTPPPQMNISELPTERYNALSDSAMDNLLHGLETLVDTLGNPAYEVEYHSGVLTLILGDKGTYVINKQPPNKQIWLSSPFRCALASATRSNILTRNESGPKRYDYHEGDNAWVYSRDGQSLTDLLNLELSDVLQRPVDVTDVVE